MQTLYFDDGGKVSVPDQDDATGHFQDNGCEVYLYFMSLPYHTHKQFVRQRVDPTNPRTALQVEKIPVWYAAVQLALNGCVVPEELRGSLSGTFAFDDDGRAILPAKVIKQLRRTKSRSR